MSRNKRERKPTGLESGSTEYLRETDRKFKSDDKHEKEPCAQSRPVMLG